VIGKKEDRGKKEEVFIYPKGLTHRICKIADFRLIGKLDLK
jgi:hypothetical protein